MLKALIVFAVIYVAMVCIPFPTANAHFQAKFNTLNLK